VSPYLCVDGAAAAIEFYTAVFGASERTRMAAPDGKIGHAELQIGDSVLMLADPYPEINVRDPKAVGGTPVMLSVYVEDVDAGPSVRGAARGCSPSEVDHVAFEPVDGLLEPFGQRRVRVHVARQLLRRQVPLLGERELGE
jgi:PhnB protein